MDRTQKWMGSVGCLGQIENIKRQSLSKAITAQYLAGMLAGELAPVSDGTVNLDEVKFVVENDDKLKYLVEAIKYVTE